MTLQLANTSASLKEVIDAAKHSNAQVLQLINVPEYMLRFSADFLAESISSGVVVRILSDESQYDDYEAGLSGSEMFKRGVGDTLQESELIDLGLERVKRVWSPGEFSLFGDLFIIWPKGFENPLRISLYDESIEEITLVDAESRRKITALKQFQINQIESFESDSILGGEEYSNQVSLEVVYIKDGTRLSVPALDFGIFPIPLIGEGLVNYDLLEQVCNQYISQGYRLKLDGFDKSHEIPPGRLKNLGELTDPSNLSGKVVKGFVSKKDSLVVLTPYELLGELNLADFELTGAAQSVDLAVKDIFLRKEEAFKKISPGDLVVHEDHGVGRYVGLLERVEGVYLEVDYAKKDKLFIPVKHPEKITKYVGAPSGIKLTTLNNGVWSRQKRKADEDAEKTARELLQVYAMRKMCRLESPKQFKLDQFQRFVTDFEFDDTEDQRVATDDILADILSEEPMDRLVVGDVGFGKTEIAIRAIYAAVLQGFQVAMLAPTTILVEQHRAVLQARFRDVGLKIASLSRYSSAQDKKETLESLGSGELDVVVGTHALLSDSIRIKNLGLIVIDEEQKFGVKQKEKLKSARVDSHVLSLSATPIPRTLNLSLSGIRDISIISTPPPGRLSIKNSFGEMDWKVANSAIRTELDRGGQVYFLHNRVGQLKELAQKLSEFFPKAHIAIAHGQMPGDKLASAMGEMAAGNIDILVCTTIIENGIDLPNVNTLIVSQAEMLGLAQLYQIRGRIGRSDKQAYAYFMFNKLRGNATARLDALSEADQLGAGFTVAARDMEIRGAGNILGKEQSGSINAVGYGLFMHLLEEKVRDMKEAA